MGEMLYGAFSGIYGQEFGCRMAPEWRFWHQSCPAINPVILGQNPLYVNKTH